MNRYIRVLWVLLAVVATGAFAQQPPLFETRKITDNVYIFRYAGHQSMFVVTPEGVIATDPIAYLRPAAAKAYIDEIRKITQAPIRYVVYSHHHYDHIAGGKPFKDLGAVFIAHKNAKTRLEALRYADAVIPDEVVDDKRVIELGGVRVELVYAGRNHSDNSLVMLVPLSLGGQGIATTAPASMTSPCSRPACCKMGTSSASATGDFASAHRPRVCRRSRYRSRNNPRRPMAMRRSNHA